MANLVRKLGLGLALSAVLTSGCGEMGSQRTPPKVEAEPAYIEGKVLEEVSTTGHYAFSIESIKGVISFQFNQIWPNDPSIEAVNTRIQQGAMVKIDSKYLEVAGKNNYRITTANFIDNAEIKLPKSTK